MQNMVLVCAVEGTCARLSKVELKFHLLSEYGFGNGQPQYWRGPGDSGSPDNPSLGSAKFAHRK